MVRGGTIFLKCEGGVSLSLRGRASLPDVLSREGQGQSVIPGPVKGRVSSAQQ